MLERLDESSKDKFEAAENEIHVTGWSQFDVDDYNDVYFKWARGKL